MTHDPMELGAASSCRRRTRRSDVGLLVLAERIAIGKDSIARRTVDRYRAQLVGFEAADEAVLASSREFATHGVDSLVRSLEREEPVSEGFLELARDIAARRLYQGVSFEALLHAGRLWGETVWEFVLAAAQPERPEEREAALAIAAHLWRHVDIVSTAMAHAYLDETIGRGVAGRDLLDALLAGRGDSEEIRRLARALQRTLGESFIVVVVRGAGAPVDDGRRQPLTTQTALDRIVAGTRAHLRPVAAPLLLGIRQGDVVALYPASQPDEVHAVGRACAALTDALTVDVSVGMSGWHHGRASIATGYAEAREAMEIAAGTGIRGRAVMLDDVLVDHMLRASPHARRILRETLRPLVEYDSAHGSELVLTLRAYVEAGANLTRSAARLTVDPNTVGYRLRRVRELCGRDPRAMADLQIIFLALKLSDLSSAR